MSLKRHCEDGGKNASHLLGTILKKSAPEVIWARTFPFAHLKSLKTVSLSVCISIFSVGALLYTDNSLLKSRMLKRLKKMFKSSASSESDLPAREMVHFFDWMPKMDFKPSRAGGKSPLLSRFCTLLL